ncbi:sugar nucleotide-binding protein [Vallitalea pronyensis]|uniref:dTDP-4-dehydrorhamnose reductase n=1 Tax=Vallitalea pronyensis TaxID=1348613 RepID=A0A8J8SIP3_9FIRM|nr:sugar nucleotide-binding protein [Vallitalea pronyensis]QUI24657.1 sugar nucleotide-binding protein [Vallitalea pronyensis]
MKKQVLILGGSGLVGRAIMGQLMMDKHVKISTTYHSSTRYTMGTSYPLDVDDIESVKQLLKKVQPTHVISCLRGDFKQQLACHKEVAAYIKKHNGWLYYCSTLNVFDQDISQGHHEEDKPQASSEYGQFKIDCEKLLLDILDQRAVILRLPQVWGKSCIRLDQLREANNHGKRITLYPKLHYNVASDHMIAKQVAHIMGHELTGIFHLASIDTILYSEFYRKLSEALGLKKIIWDEQEDEQGQFVLIPNRVKQFPKHLQETCDDVICYVAGADFV